ncbi:MAG: hypothetical protein GY807_11190 [Gammaproteobacteria bacterium]|nr:hypothetical protein [Gammaproteobacteria bacterium]
MIESYLQALWTILLDLAPALLAGLLLAGLLHEFLPRGLIRRRLSASTMGSVFRAVMIGVPMPLCSCGVVPTAIGLRNDGASKGAATAFLISTPQTGVDSILVSASFLGWPFAIFKVIAAFVTGLIGGGLVNRLVNDEVETAPPAPQDEGRRDRRGPYRLISVLRYAIFDLLAAIDMWILVGILIAAAISIAFPPDYLSQVSWAQGLGGMFLVLIVSLPLYICTTGSVPIAASLIAAGMPLGSALVFLMAGPATNVATMGAVYRALGGKVLGLYLAVVVFMSMALGLGFDFLLGDVQQISSHQHHQVSWVSTVSALLLCGLFVYHSGLRLKSRWPAKTAERIDHETNLTLKVDGMSCQHCVTNVKDTLEVFDEVEEATPELSSGLVRIRGESLDTNSLTAAVEKAGFKVVERK